MRKLLLKIAIFALLFFALDRAFILLEFKNDNVFAKITDEKVELLRQELHESGREHEVLVFGSSHAQFGIDAEALGEALERRAFNLAYGGGAHAGDQLLLLRSYLATGRVPELVLYAIEVFTLNEPPHSELPAVESLVGDMPSELRDPWSSLKGRLRRLSHAYKYGRSLPRYLADIARGEWTPPYFRPGGQYDLSMFRSFAGYELTDSGWVAGDGVLDPRFVRYANADFAPDPESVEALEAFADECEAAGSRLVLVHIPEHSSALRHGEKYVAFRTWMEAFCARRALPYLDFNDPERFAVGRDELFFDSDHLNREGARVFTRLLGVEVAEFLLVEE